MHLLPKQLGLAVAETWLFPNSLTIQLKENGIMPMWIAVSIALVAGIVFGFITATVLIISGRK